MSNNVLQPGQEQELREIIQDWLVKNPGSHFTGYIPFPEFAREAGKYPPSRGVQPGSIFSLLFLDPLARLDPTRQALEESKYLAERGMFYLQRRPRILQEQTQYTFLDLAQTREIQQAQAQAERFTRTAERFARAAEQLPENVREERTAAVRQILEGLATERTNFFNQLLTEQEALQGSLKELQEAFATGKETAANVHAAAQALSGFVEEIEKARKLKSQPGSRPFDVREYGTAARDIGVGAERLNALLSSVEERGPQLNLALSQARKVTVVSPEGKKTTFKARPEVANFDQIRVGDQVKATLTQQMVVSMGTEGSRQSEGATSTIQVAPKGAKPGVMVADTVQITTKVVGIDQKQDQATLQFPDGSTRTFPVRKDVDLTQRRVGEEVVIRQTQTQAISVEKP